MVDGVERSKLMEAEHLNTCSWEEEESLRDKIRADHERALQEAKEKLRKSKEELKAEIQTEKTKVAEDLKKKDGPKPLPPVPMPKLVGVNDGDPGDTDTKEKRDKIREIFSPSSTVQVLILPLSPLVKMTSISAGVASKEREDSL
ncbi:Mannosyl-oligosaccharide 1,2-alpha-mannosidase IB [Anabarilius grahami]|uniref:Mannosyl-oligosaccharide 1,2-alpha-mannosidase IB n=1 Tax=Anabarilius grahami TaxID=495550 RepID=A0A3N0YW90_ANAGA|nr:Mannosyl-oligosaccharide 1,2-alpha-mannosidase IB [Anabarilius grahami]